MASKWGNFLQILERVGPIILAANPATAAIAPVVVHAIAEAEAIKGSSGPDKKKHALAIVADAVGIANTTGVKGFENPTLVLSTVSDGIDTVVGVIGVIEGTKGVVKVV